MVNDSSLGGSPSQVPFDLDSEAGLMQLLSSVRASKIPADEKNELRDQIFLYISGSKEPAVRSALESKIAQHQITPTASTNAAVETPKEEAVSTFGASRRAPNFSDAAPAQTAPAANGATPATEPAPAPAPEPPPVATPQPAPAPQPVTPAPQPVPAEPTPESPPAPQPAPTPAPVAATPEPEPAAEPALAPQPEPAQAPSNQTADASLARIREIKSLVNEKVGNPVNLVDIDNEVGREYMAAMLDAMKQVSGGAVATTAMQRLEAAYVQVEKTIANQGVTASSPEPTPAQQTAQSGFDSSAAEPTPAPVEEPSPAPTPEPVPEPQPEIAPAPEPTPPVMPAEDVPLPEAIKKAEPAPTPTQEESTPWTNNPEPGQQAQPETHEGSAARKVDMAQTPEVEPAEIPTQPHEVHNELNAVTGLPADIPRGAPAVQKVNATHNSLQKPLATTPSLADAPVKLKTPENLADPASVETSSVAGDPLYTKEVDDGLQQLLVEWPIFKKSGLFGTGPKGREHPLFVKIAGLQIPLLLAGRFEGATQEIKQSITDYMNGWRYEQGIIYNQGETFEHYLRRVIRHILDLQNRAKPS